LSIPYAGIMHVPKLCVHVSVKGITAALLNTALGLFAPYVRAVKLRARGYVPTRPFIAGKPDHVLKLLPSNKDGHLVQKGDVDEVGVVNLILMATLCPLPMQAFNRQGSVA